MRLKKKNPNTEKKSEIDLHKLKRIELLEILVEQGKENERLLREIEELKAESEKRTICLKEAGNIAEASLALNHIMEDAQAAARQYLDSVQQLCSRMEEEALEKCAAMERETVQKCIAMERDTERKCSSMERETMCRCAAMEQESRNDEEK